MARSALAMPGPSSQSAGSVPAALERFGAGGQEEGIVPPPDRQQGRPVRAEEGVQPRVLGDVGAVVEQQVHLRFDADPLDGRVGQLPWFGRDQRGVRHAFRVLPFDRLARVEAAQRLAVLGRGLGPGAAHVVPAGAQSFLVAVAVLAHDGRDLVRVLDRQAPADRGAIVEHVHGEAFDALGDGEGIDHAGQPVERVVEGETGRDGGLAEAGQVGRKDMPGVGQPRDQVAEHVRRGAEAVQQQDGGRVRRAGFAVEKVDALDVDRTVMDWIHVRSSDGRQYGWITRIIDLSGYLERSMVGSM